MYIQASIGRNVANVPMGDTAWERFREDTRDAILIAIYATHPDLPGLRLQSQFQFHAGQGEWGGVKEESMHVSVYFEWPVGVGRANEAAIVEDLNDRLVEVAREYGQDAIAFVVTDSHLALRS